MNYKVNTQHRLLFVFRLEHFFYVIAIIMLFILVLDVYNLYQYMKSLEVSGQLFIAKELLKVITTYMNTIAPDLFYACTLFGIGRIIKYLNRVTTVTKIIKSDNKILEEEEDDIDEFLTNSYI